MVARRDTRLSLLVLASLVVGTFLFYDFGTRPAEAAVYFVDKNLGFANSGGSGMAVLGTSASNTSGKVIITDGGSSTLRAADPQSGAVTSTISGLGTGGRAIPVGSYVYLAKSGNIYRLDVANQILINSLASANIGQPMGAIGNKIYTAFYTGSNTIVGYVDVSANTMTFTSVATLNTADCKQTLTNFPGVYDSASNTFFMVCTTASQATFSNLVRYDTSFTKLASSQILGATKAIGAIGVDAINSRVFVGGSTSGTTGIFPVHYNSTAFYFESGFNASTPITNSGGSPISSYSYYLNGDYFYALTSATTNQLSVSLFNRTSPFTLSVAYDISPQGSDTATGGSLMGDGTYIYVVRSANGATVHTDTAVISTLTNGVTSSGFGIDTNGDGVPDFYIPDTNGDGVPDFTWQDTPAFVTPVTDSVPGFFHTLFGLETPASNAIAGAIPPMAAVLLLGYLKGKKVEVPGFIFGIMFLAGMGVSVALGWLDAWWIIVGVLGFAASFGSKIKDWMG